MRLSRHREIRFPGIRAAIEYLRFIGTFGGNERRWAARIVAVPRHLADRSGIRRDRYSAFARDLFSARDERVYASDNTRRCSKTRTATGRRNWKFHEGDYGWWLHESWWPCARGELFSVPLRTPWTSARFFWERAWNREMLRDRRFPQLKIISPWTKGRQRETGGKVETSVPRQYVIACRYVRGTHLYDSGR